MKRSIFFINQKYTLISLSLIIFSAGVSLYLFQFIYDGHHHGLMFSNAVDLLNSKKPYAEIFIQYGFLTTFIHSISLLFLGYKIFSLHFVTIIFYSFSIFFIFLITKKLVNEKIALISVLVLLLNHPIPWMPWSNYIAYFFIVLSIYFLIKKLKYNYLLTGFCLGLCVLSRQDYFLPIIVTFFLFNLIYLLTDFSYNKLLDIGKILIGFVSPISIFFLYLYFNNLIFIWTKYLILPSLYLELNDVSIFSYVINFIKFFFTDALLNFINKPQYLLIFAILLINSIFLIKFCITKKYDLIFISLLCLTLSSIGISLELFRLYTSVSLGVVVLIQVISNIKSDDLRKFSFFFLLSTSIFSITFYPWGNNEFFKKINISKHYETPESSLFVYNKWVPQKVRVLNKILDLKKNILSNCNIQYGENLTFDNYFSNILNLNRVRLAPHVKSDHKNHKIDTFFNINFISRINELIIKKNIIILITENNHSYNAGSIILNNSYSYELIKLNSINEKPRFLKFYYPSKCYVKS